MPWKESSAMEERLRFVARLIEGEAMTDLCLEFGISRKTGYKIFNRYKEEGLAALTDRSRRPVHYANQLPAQIEALNRHRSRGEPAITVQNLSVADGGNAIVGNVTQHGNVIVSDRTAAAATRKAKAGSGSAHDCADAGLETAGRETLA